MIPRGKRPVVGREDTELHWEEMIDRFRRAEERRRRGIVGGLVAILLVLLVLAALLVAERACAAEALPDVAFAWHGERAEWETKIDTFLAGYFSKCSPRKLARARTVVSDLLDVCQAEGVNPALVAAIVSLESTWDAGAVGGLGERGLMQVAPNARRGEVPEDAAGQLRLGVRILTESFARCGTTLGAVSWYGTGHTCRPYRGAERRIRMAAKIEGVR